VCGGIFCRTLLLPDQMIYDHPNQILANVVFACEFALLSALAGIFLAYLSNLFPSQLMRWRIFPSHRVLPSRSRLFFRKPFIFIRQCLHRTKVSNCPVDSFQNVPNRSLSNSKLRGQNILFTYFPGVLFSNLKGLDFCYFAMTAFTWKLVLRSLKKSVFNLVRCVSRVVCRVSEIQMIRVHAKRNVSSGTAMQHPFAFWNWAAMKNPRGAMRSDISTPFGSHHSYFPVSILRAICVTILQISLPKPVGRSDKNFLPKSFGKVLRETLRSQKLGRKLESWSNHRLLCRVPGGYWPRRGTFRFFPELSF